MSHRNPPKRGSPYRSQSSIAQDNPAPKAVPRFGAAGPPSPSSQAPPRPVTTSVQGSFRPFKALVTISTVTVVALFIWSLSISGVTLSSIRSPRRPCVATCPSSSLLDERPAADWTVSAKALTVSVLNLPHSPLVNKRRHAKIAFLFLVQKDLPHQRLWARFFKGNELFYTIQVHTWSKSTSFQSGNVEPCFESTEIPWRTKSPFRPSSQQATNVIDAQRRLLAWALMNPDNYFFVFFTEFCIPIRNFTSVYDYIVRSKQSFVDMRDFKGQDATFGYTNKLEPLIPQQHFATGLPWGTALGRTHATAVLGDTMFYKVFKAHCRGREGSWPKRTLALQMPSKKKDCLPEYHYIQSFLHVVDPEGVNQRTLTHEDSLLVQKEGIKPEDKTLRGLILDKGINAEHFSSIQAENGILPSPFEPEVPCLLNGARQHCYLFARPYSPSQTERLLQLLYPLLFS